MIINVLLIILELLTCTVLSGCGTTVKEVEQAPPVNTASADAEDTSEEKHVDRMTEKLETIAVNENLTGQENEIIMGIYENRENKHD